MFLPAPFVIIQEVRNMRYEGEKEFVDRLSFGYRNTGDQMVTKINLGKRGTTGSE